MSKISDVQFSANGSKLDFGAYATDTDFKEIGAVYAFTRRYKSDGKFYHDILYVGQTDNLQRRMNAHDKMPQAVNRGCNCICVHVDTTQSTRLKKEHNMLCQHKPPCNEKLPDDCS